MEYIYKKLWWNCKWEFHQRVSEWDYNFGIYDIYKDVNKNWLVRYKKIKVNLSASCYNSNNKLKDLC
jgi:hypothetical protein